MKRAVAGLLVALAACTGGEPTWVRADLPDLVLQADDAPAGTGLDTSASGFRTTAEFAEDEQEQQAFADAGMTDAYYAWFISPQLFDAEGNLSPKGSIAFAFALLFDDVGGATKGLELLEQDVRSDGSDISARATDGLPAESFGLFGLLDPRRPPGFIFAWRRGNAVLGLVAGGAPGAIREEAARELAIRMSQRSR